MGTETAVAPLRAVELTASLTVLLKVFQRPSWLTLISQQVRALRRGTCNRREIFESDASYLYAAVLGDLVNDAISSLPPETLTQRGRQRERKRTAGAPRQRVRSVPHAGYAPRQFLMATVPEE